MNTMMAFAAGEANRGRPMMVFDWNKAAKLIAKKKPREASAGLENDWEWTGGTIYESGKPVEDSYTYLASTWATPQLRMDGVTVPCFVMESKTKWNSGTKWPKSALAILKSNPSIHRTGGEQ